MPKTFLHRHRKHHRTEFATEASDALIQLWLLRLLVPLEGYKLFLRERDFRDDDLTRAVGYGHYIDEDGDCVDYDRKAILSDLRRRWKEAEHRGLKMPTETPLACNIVQLGEALGLSEAEMRTVHFAVLAKQDDTLEAALELMGSLSLNKLERLFAVCLDLSAAEVRRALAEDGALFRTGILQLDLDHNYNFGNKVELLRGLPDELHRHHDDPLGLFRNNLAPSPPPRLTAGHYPHLARESPCSDGCAAAQRPRYQRLSRRSASIGFLEATHGRSRATSSRPGRAGGQGGAGDQRRDSSGGSGAGAFPDTGQYPGSPGYAAGATVLCAHGHCLPAGHPECQLRPG